MKMKRLRTSRLQVGILVLALAMMAVACGDDTVAEPAAAVTPTTAAPDMTPGALTPTTEAPAMRDVTLALSTTSGFGYGFHIALALGYYADEGLNVSLQGTGGSSDVAQILAAGNADAGMGVPGAMLPAIEAGANLYPFFTYAYGEVFDVVVALDSAIQTMDEAAGLSIGISELAGGEVPLLRALLVEAGVDPDADASILEVGASAATVQNAFDNGDIQIYSGAKSDIAQMGAAGFETRSIAPSSLDTLPAEGLLATEETKDDRDLLIAIGRATAKGQLIAYANEDAAVCVLKEVIPEEFTDDEVGRAGLASVIPITKAPEDDDGIFTFGYLDAGGWNTYVGIFMQGGVITENIDMTPLVLSDLLEGINEFDQAAIVDEANSLPTDC